MEPPPKKQAGIIAICLVCRALKRPDRHGACDLPSVNTCPDCQTKACQWYAVDSADRDCPGITLKRMVCLGMQAQGAGNRRKSVLAGVLRELGFGGGSVDEAAQQLSVTIQLRSGFWSVADVDIDAKLQQVCVISISTCQSLSHLQDTDAHSM